LKDIVWVIEIQAGEVARTCEPCVEAMSDIDDPQEEEAEGDGEEQNNGPPAAFHLRVSVLLGDLEPPAGSAGH